MLTQQLQADELAVDVSTQLFSVAPHHAARIFYSTMVQDEARQVEAWAKLVIEVGGTAERDPYLDQLAHLMLESDTLEEKVFLMQVLYERFASAELRLIGTSSRGTILGDISNRFVVDESIHHVAGTACEHFLLEHAPSKTKAHLEKTAKKAIPVLIEHALWRPRSRSPVLADATFGRNIQWLRVELDGFLGLARSLGLDLSDDLWRLPTSRGVAH